MEWLNEIAALKSKVGVPTDTAECPVAPPEKPAAGAFPEGTFETTITGDDWRTRCGTDPGFVELRLDVTFSDGSLEEC